MLFHRPSTVTRQLLVVAGEGSGDALAAPVVSRLRVASFGMGGPALRGAGCEIVVDQSSVAAMGVAGVLRRAPALVAAACKLLLLARRRRPAAALLVGYSEFNGWLGPRLRRLGVRVLWYGAPQIWAWRAGRGARFAQACDRMAVLLPFESALWRALGVDVHLVGHPARDVPRVARAELRSELGLAPRADYVALLPGSRTEEVRRMLQPMLDAVDVLRAERGALDARVLLAPALPKDVTRWAQARATASGIDTLSLPAGSVARALPAFDVAIATSGTVTLECAVAGVPPVIGYRTGLLTAAVVRRLVHVPHIGLPNLVLGRRCFPELVQRDVTPDALAEAAGRLLDARRDYVAECERVRDALPGGASSEAVAQLIEPWLDEAHAKHDPAPFAGAASDMTVAPS